MSCADSVSASKRAAVGVGGRGTAGGESSEKRAEAGEYVEDIEDGEVGVWERLLAEDARDEARLVDIGEERTDDMGEEDALLLVRFALVLSTTASRWTRCGNAHEFK